MRWPLNVSNFNILDKIKLCLFLLNEKNFWTMSRKVEEFEHKMADFIGVKHAVFVANGSVANSLIAMRLKDSAFSKSKRTIVFPSTTWITSISPFVREGFTPKFIDVNFKDFSIDLDKLEEYLESSAEEVACVFITSLLGFVPDIDRLQIISKKYGVTVMMDNCENTLGSFSGKNVSSFFTSSTSTYFGHQLQSVEGGFVFTNSKEEADYFRMARNHGMTRSLPQNERSPYSNPDVDERFDFFLMGNNFRNSDIHAYVGLLDFARKEEYVRSRNELYEFFAESLTEKRFVLPASRGKINHVAFALPVIPTKDDPGFKSKMIEFCRDAGIETRPIISGNLLRQTCLKKYGKPELFKNSEFLHRNGFYVGLHNKLKKKDITFLVNKINQIS